MEMLTEMKNVYERHINILINVLCRGKKLVRFKNC